MNLKYKNGSRYVNVPSAYDVGSETGETSEGIAVSWVHNTAHLTPGPSMVYGMWNISSSNAMTLGVVKLYPTSFPETFLVP